MSGRAPVSITGIQEALAARGLSPLHRFGQNFMVEPKILDRLVREGGVSEGDRVLEVGPGLGGVTERLLDLGAWVTAVEIDRGLADHMEDLFAGVERFTLIRGDVMGKKAHIREEVLAAWHAGSGVRRVVSNLPYQISSPFIAGLVSENAVPWEIASLTLQKEVGDVLLAHPGSEHYSPLSFLSRVFFSVRKVTELSPTCFLPRPKVRSVIMGIERLKDAGCRPSEVIPFARLLFSQRRKALRSTVVRAAAALAWPTEAVPDALRRANLVGNERIDGVPPSVIVSLALDLLAKKA